MLTETRSDAPRIADPDRGPRPPALLSLHRRFELLVAVLAVGAVTVLAIEAEPASAQTKSRSVTLDLAAASDLRPSGSEAALLQRKIRCKTVSSRLQEGRDG